MEQSELRSGHRIRTIRTYSDAWLARHRETHAKHSEFGTHRHPYLLAPMREIATALTLSDGEPPSLLDYGCGKGVFLQEMGRTGLFRFIRGYDPAIEGLNVRPTQTYDVVTCLDVLDQLEDTFVEPVIQDVMQFTRHTAVFDVITVQTPALAHLNPRSAAVWRDIVGRHMSVDSVTVRPATAQELAQGACPERTIILARHQRSG